MFHIISKSFHSHCRYLHFPGQKKNCEVSESLVLLSGSCSYTLAHHHYHYHYRYENMFVSLWIPIDISLSDD